MEIRKCSGCGALLQTEDPNLPGYVPESSLRQRKKVLCRRCFRLRHYGAVERVSLSAEDYERGVHRAIEGADGLLVVVDIVDFEGSFDDNLLSVCRRPFIVVVNKMDLLPPVVPWSEVEDWVHQRFEAKGLIPDSCVGISSQTGAGVGRLWDEMIGCLGQRIALVGVTNTGKSTLLNRILRKYGEEGVKEAGPTVSDVAGTTLGILEYDIPGEDVVLIDTPGLIPTGRLSDMVCEKCQRTLVPHKPLASRLVEVGPGESVILSQYCQVDVLEVTNAIEAKDHKKRAVIVAYAPGDVTVHRTRKEKADKLRTAPHAPMFTSPCADCLSHMLQGSWTTREFRLSPGWDLAVSGLGWISLRRFSASIRLTLPEGVKTVRRINLVGRKDLAWR